MKTVSESKTYKCKTPCGNLYLIVPLEPEKVPMYSELGKSGVCSRAFSESLTAFADILNKHQYITRKKFIEVLQGITCTGADGVENFSCMDAIAKLLKEKVWVEDEKQES